MKFLLNATLWLMTLSAVAQQPIQVGKPAPAVLVSDWIANVPADKTLIGYPVVLEFWATWCGPCIAAVPHMNELQAKFADSPLRFVSITDEPAEKVNRLLKRVTFQSIVVSDKSRKTQDRFGAEAIPLTVLIDKQNVVRWIGQPKGLTEDVLRAFLAGTLSAPTSKTAMLATTSTADDYGTFLQVMKQTELPYTFRMATTDQVGSASTRMGSKGVFYASVGLPDLWWNLFGVPKGQLLLPGSVANLRYNLLYKNTRDGDKALDTLRHNILNKLQLVSRSETRTVMVYHCRVKDTQRLDPSQDKYSSRLSDAEDKLIFDGQTLTNVLAELTNRSGKRFVGIDVPPGKYDFVIQITSPEAIRDSLASYGITTEVGTEPAEFVWLEPRL